MKPYIKAFLPARKTKGLRALPRSLALIVVALSAWMPLAASAQGVVMHDFVVAGAFPAPPMGNGPGKLALVQPAQAQARAVDFGTANSPAGNSFYIANNPGHTEVFVPTLAGKTLVIDPQTGMTLRQFDSIAGGRVARVWVGHGVVFVLSGKVLAAYSTHDGALRFDIPVGGNALAFNADASRLYVGGNLRTTIAEIDPADGHVLRQIPIGHSGDLAWARGRLYSANMQSGVMSVFNPANNHIVSIATSEVDPQFSYAKIPAATAGFMQLAVGPRQNHVYAAGFSGHILRFSTRAPAYAGEVRVSAGQPGPAKLSGLAVLPGGRQAIVTIENRHEAVIVALRSGKVLRRLPGIASNRWVLTR